MSIAYTPPIARGDERIILHFDYDCFYAAVFENEVPSLRSLPLAVQQKQIIVTCNYEARRRGLYKLQLVKDAKSMCPEVVVVLGEDLTRFRNASKDNYDFLRAFSWSNKVERLGFDEVFLDVTDMVEYNVELLNSHTLNSSFFYLSKSEPTEGFEFDASGVCGHTVPASALHYEPGDESHQTMLYYRLTLGAHLAQYLRSQLEDSKGYTSTVGISTNKLLSKLVGNVHKPNSQTTLLPPYRNSYMQIQGNVLPFLDGHDIGKIPGIGFKSSQKIRSHVLGRPAKIEPGLVYGSTKDKLSVKEVRLTQEMGSGLLEKLLGGPGAPKGIGSRTWGLINGVDESEVSRARDVPHQISFEDSYIRLDTMDEVVEKLQMLAKSLIRRMRVDLCTDGKPNLDLNEANKGILEARTHETKRWLAHPRTLRLTTRSRPPLNPDGSRTRTFNRISKSCSMPSTVFNLDQNIDLLADRLVHETLIPLFRKLHPEKAGWNLSLMNICAASISPTADVAKDGTVQSISTMFKKQGSMLNQQSVPEEPTEASDDDRDALDRQGIIYSRASNNQHLLDTKQNQDAWIVDDEISSDGSMCDVCGAIMPPFALAAHHRFHMLSE